MNTAETNERISRKFGSQHPGFGHDAPCQSDYRPSAGKPQTPPPPFDYRAAIDQASGELVFVKDYEIDGIKIVPMS